MENILLGNQISSFSADLLPAKFDFKRVLGNVYKHLNPARSDFMLKYHMSEAKNGYVVVSFALPEGMANCFVGMFECMTGIMKGVEIKARSAFAQERAISLDETEKKKHRYEANKKLVCSVFDKYLKEGRTRNEAISLTNSTLKKKGHVWVTYEIVKDILRAERRFKKMT